MRKKLTKKQRNILLITGLIIIIAIIFNQYGGEGLWITGSLSTEERCQVRLEEEALTHEFCIGCIPINLEVTNCLISEGQKEGVADEREITKFIDDIGNYAYFCASESNLQGDTDREKALQVVFKCFGGSIIEPIDPECEKYGECVGDKLYYCISPTKAGVEIFDGDAPTNHYASYSCPNYDKKILDGVTLCDDGKCVIEGLGFDCVWVGPCPQNNPDCLCERRDDGDSCEGGYMCKSLNCINGKCSKVCTPGETKCCDPEKDNCNGDKWLLTCSNEGGWVQSLEDGRCGYDDDDDCTKNEDCKEGESCIDGICLKDDEMKFNLPLIAGIGIAVFGLFQLMKGGKKRRKRR